MRPVGFFVALVGVAGIIVGILSIVGVHIFRPTGSLGDVRLPGAGPIIAGLILLCAGLAVARYRAPV